MIHRILLALLYVTIASFIFTIFSTDPGVNVDSRNNMPALLSGDAHRPFAYRPLMPQVIHRLAAILPDSMWNTFVHYRWQQEVDHELYRADIDKTYVKEWYLFKWITILCFTAFGACIFMLIREFYQLSLTESHFLALLGIAFLPLFFGPANLLYDPTTLLFFPLAFICAYRKQFGWYYLVFILAAFNKELSILLIPAFAVICWKEISRKHLAMHLITQCALFGAIALGIRYYYSDNLGEPFEHKFFPNIIFLTTPSIFLAEFILKVLVLGYLVFQGWREKNLLLRRSFLVIFVPLVILMSFAARISELRDLYEIVFLVYLLSIPTLREELSGGRRTH